jgi:adenylate cyclase class 2
MKEVEAKILEVNRAKIEQTLNRLGAQKVFDGDIDTLFFDFKDGSIVKAQDVLRLRKEGDKNELTYKKVRFEKNAKKAEEISVEVSNMQSIMEILENLGLQVTARMQKHRESFTLKKARFDIDQYEGAYGFIPEFLEIEAEDAEAIHEYAALLGFAAEKCLPWSTNDLIQHYEQEKRARNKE